MTLIEAQFDAGIECLLKAQIAASGLEAQLHHATQALREARGASKVHSLSYNLAGAREALRVAQEKEHELSHRLRGQMDVFGLRPTTILHELVRLEGDVHRAGGSLTPEAKDTLAAIAAKIAAREIALRNLSKLIDDEIRAMRARARGRPEPEREPVDDDAIFSDALAVQDIADAIAEQEREELNELAREEHAAKMSKLH